MTNLFFGIISGIIADFIFLFLVQRRKNFKKKNKIIIASISFPIIFLSVYIIPPYKITDVDWCMKENDTIKITGRLGSVFLGKSISNYDLRVNYVLKNRNISNPIKPDMKKEKNLTFKDGRFDVLIHSDEILHDMIYIISISYEYSFLFLKREKTSYFELDNPPDCKIKKSNIYNKFAETPKVKAVVGIRTEENDILKKSKFLFGVNIWVKILCLVKSPLEKLEIQWDEYQKWEEIPKKTIKNIEEGAQVILPHIYKKLGHHVISIRCFTSKKASEIINGENKFTVNIERAN